MNDALKLAFERNGYFTGKLLSAKDFIVEQNYFNGKRRLLNLFTEGQGILYGLEVLKTGDNRQEESISIKPGIAIDPLGREIIIPEIDTRVLSDLEGFPEDEYIGALYLCIEYDESGKAEAYLAEGKEEDNSQKHYNRIAEGYKLVLKTGPPPTPLSSYDRLRYTIQALYADDKVIIWHKSPRYIGENEGAEASFICTKLQKNLRVSVEYQAAMKELLPVVPGPISFESSERSEITEFEYKYFIKGTSVDGSISFNNENLKIMIGDHSATMEPRSVTVQSIDIPVRDKVISDYYKENLRDLVDNRQKEHLYLAKIFITQARSALGIRYHINHVEKTIFSNYIHPKQLTQCVSDNPGPQNTVDFNAQPPLQPPAETKPEPEVKTGVIEMNLDLERNHSKYSEEIQHGLGVGPVLVATGLEEASINQFAQRLGNNEVIYSGDYGVFNDSKYASEHAGLSIGVMTYPRKGCFVIGISSTEKPIKATVRIRWWAFRTK